MPSIGELLEQRKNGGAVAPSELKVVVESKTVSDTLELNIDSIAKALEDKTVDIPELTAVIRSLGQIAEGIKVSTSVQGKVLSEVSKIDNSKEIKALSKEISGMKKEMTALVKSNKDVLTSLDQVVALLGSPKMLEFDDDGMPVSVRIGV